MADEDRNWKNDVLDQRQELDARHEALKAAGREEAPESLKQRFEALDANASTWSFASNIDVLGRVPPSHKPKSI